MGGWVGGCACACACIIVVNNLFKPLIYIYTHDVKGKIA
jgi:hypothetical protein